MPPLIPRPCSHSCDISNRVEKKMKEIQVLVSQLGGLLNEMKPPLCSIDPVKKKAYDNIYHSLMSILSTAPIPVPVFSHPPVRQRSMCQSVSLGMIHSDSISSFSSVPSSQCSLFVLFFDL